MDLLSSTCWKETGGGPKPLYSHCATFKFQTQLPLSQLQAWSYLQLTSHSDCSLSRVQHPAVLCGSGGESHVININKLCSSLFAMVSKPQETRHDMDCSNKKETHLLSRCLDLKIIGYRAYYLHTGTEDVLHNGSLTFSFESDWLPECMCQKGTIITWTSCTCTNTTTWYFD